MSAVMAKKKTKQVESDQDRHKYPVLSVRPPDAMRAILEARARAQRRSMSQTILLLLEQALTAEGLWPPPEGGDSV